MYFDANIKLLRKRRGRTQDEVAEKLGMKRSTLSGYENQVAQPGLDVLLLFSDYYQVAVDTLVALDFDEDVVAMVPPSVKHFDRVLHQGGIAGIVFLARTNSAKPDFGASFILLTVLIAILGGVIIGRLKPERFVEDFVWQIQVGQQAQGAAYQPTWDDRLRDAARVTREIVGKVWPFVVIGIAIGAGIHGYVPEDFLADIMGHQAWWSVPAAVVLGIPLYSNAAGVIPVVYALMEKGAAMGTVLAFMMSVVALSLPEILILRRVLKPQLIGIFIGIVGVAIILTGYLFNLVIR